MQILVNTDNKIKGHAPLVTRVSAAVEHSLQRFKQHLTRVEVHLSDESGSKSGAHDQRCTIEARMQHRQPISVKHEASNIDQAVDAALQKLERSIDKVLERQRDKHGAPLLVEPEPAE